MATRISQTFAGLREKGKRAIIPFITAGDPSLATTRDLLVELARAGAHIIELGVPFSDPVADGPVIQRASMRALQNNVGLEEILGLVNEVRRDINVPIVLFSYLNPLMQFGLDRLVAEAAAVGVDGILITDLALEDAHEFKALLADKNMDLILLVAPTTNDERLRVIAKNAAGFIYAVSRTGVTGAQSSMSEEAERLVARVRAITDLPVAVGFGISSRAQIRAVWEYADAAVIGSAIVAQIEELAGEPNLPERLGSFLQDLFPFQNDLGAGAKW